MRSLFLIALAVLAAGCGRSPQFAPIEGAVTAGGHPLANVEIVFVPEPGTSGREVAAYTGADGRYRIAHDPAAGLGVPVGTHRVLVRDADMYLVPPGGVDPESGEQLPGAKDRRAGGKRSRVPLAYGDAVKTPLRGVEVRPGEQTFDIAIEAK